MGGGSGWLETTSHYSQAMAGGSEAKGSATTLFFAGVVTRPRFRRLGGTRILQRRISNGRREGLGKRLWYKWLGTMAAWLMAAAYISPMNKGPSNGTVVGKIAN